MPDGGAVAFFLYLEILQERFSFELSVLRPEVPKVGGVAGLFHRRERDGTAVLKELQEKTSGDLKLRSGRLGAGGVESHP